LKPQKPPAPLAPPKRKWGCRYSSSEMMYLELMPAEVRCYLRLNDVSFVSCSKLNFNFVATVRFEILKKQIQATGARLRPLLIL
jgi:hypothetical protein